MDTATTGWVSIVDASQRVKAGILVVGKAKLLLLLRDTYLLCGSCLHLFLVLLLLYPRIVQFSCLPSSTNFQSAPGQAISIDYREDRRRRRRCTQQKDSLSDSQQGCSYICVWSSPEYRISVNVSSDWKCQ